MLETASRSDERPVALVWTAGRDPETIKTRQRLIRSGIKKRRRGDPFGFHTSADGISRVLKGRVGREVRVIFRIEIAEDADANWFCGHTQVYHGRVAPPRA